MVSPVTQAQTWAAGRHFPAEKPLLNVAQAVPGYPPPNPLTAFLADQVGKPEVSVYTGIFGLPELRAALAEHINQDYGAAVRPEHVAIVAGCNQAFCVVVTTLAQPNDEILLPLPYYFNHQMWLEIQGIRPVYLPFSDSDGAIPDPAAAARLITARTRAIVLVTPNNPTGAVYPPETIDAFYRLAQRHDLALIIDETYKDFRASHAPAHSLFHAPNWPDTLIQLYSFSKAYSLTGYRVGSITASDAFLTQIGKLLDCVTICAPHIGQQAALYGLAHLNAWREEKRRLMQERVAALRMAFRRDDLRYEVVSAGAYFAYLRHPFTGESAQRVARRLVDEQHILCLPGSTFGPGQEDYLRFAFANLEAERMAELAARLVASQA